LAGDEHELPMQSSLGLDHSLRHIVEHHDTVLADFDARALGATPEFGRDHEHRVLEFSHRHFPCPAEPTDDRRWALKTRVVTAFLLADSHDRQSSVL